MFARNATPLSPSLLKLEPEQRMRLIRSSHKVGQMLGATPVVDVISPSSTVFSPTPIPQAAADLQSRRGAHFLGSLQSHIALFHSAASQVSAHDDAMKSPVVRYKIAHDAPGSAAALGHAMLRRAHVPAALPLDRPTRTEASPLSPFRFGLMRSPPSALFSAKPVVPPFSPITERKIQQRKLEKLDTLQKLAACDGGAIPQELIYPSLGQVGDKADQITSYLDLYRMGTKDDVHVPRAQSSVQDKSSVWNEVGVPDSTPSGRRVSRSLQATRRRSRSVSDFYSFSDALEIGSPRTYGTEKRLSRQLHTPSYIVPSATSSRLHPFANPCASPQVVPETLEDMVMSPRPRADSLKEARRTILGMDAQLMAEFRHGFGMRPHEFTLAPFPAPTGPLPSPPVSARLAAIKSPKAPYWVKSSFRPRGSFEFAQFAQIDPYADSPARVLPPVTPRTRRIERRQGWGGMWNKGNMAGVIGHLKEL